MRKFAVDRRRSTTAGLAGWLTHDDDKDQRPASRRRRGGTSPALPSALCRRSAQPTNYPACQLDAMLATRLVVAVHPLIGLHLITVRKTIQQVPLSRLAAGVRRKQRGLGISSDVANLVMELTAASRLTTLNTTARDG